MRLHVRDMTLGEADLVIDYFLGATPEYLDMMGVDPSRLMTREAWRAHMQQQFALPPLEREVFRVTWLLDDAPVGYSSCDKVVAGEQAFMHLHVLIPDLRRQGIGTECVRLSADVYFEMFGLKRLFCQPHAFNTAPHRTLQKAGFKFVKTYMTVPGAINYHQAVTQWVLER